MDKTTHKGDKTKSDSFETAVPSTSYGPGPSGAQRSGGLERGLGSPEDEEVLEFPGEECRMVLMGKTGNGKSSTGNTIVGIKRFEVGRGMGSKTVRCQWHNSTRFGIKIEVVDTPGFFDTHKDDVTVRKEVMRCVGMVSPGPHALLLVVRLDVRFTNEEAESVKEIRSLFGDDVMRHMIIVFTHGDSLEEDLSAEEALQQVLNEAPPALCDILKVVDRRYVVFNNKAPTTVKNEEVRQLLLTVRGMLCGTDNQHFSTPFLKQCEQAVMTRATELGELLDSKVASGRLRDLIRAGLESRESLEQLLHQVLDQQSGSEKEIRDLQHALEKSQALQDDLDKQLVNNVKELSEKDEKLRQKDEDLRKKDETLQNKDEDLRKKDEDLRKKDEDLRKKDKDLRKKDEELTKEKARWHCDIL